MIKKLHIISVTVIFVLIISSYYFLIYNTKDSVIIQSEDYKLRQIFTDLQFSSIVSIQSVDTYPNNLFVVEQQGKIQLVENINTTNPTKTEFLDITQNVISGGEKGLLGLAFDPNFNLNGFFYVDYTIESPLQTRISRFSIETINPWLVDITSEHVILQVSQPYSNHNAGDIAFGLDGFLYITLGDGGSGGDPNGNGQNKSTLLGSILRIDVSQSNITHPYAIPDDNPFFGNSEGYKEEIFAYGLRNPWRISFDSVTGDLWTGDVGQGAYEEVDIVEKGKNYGWNIMEGENCYNSNSCNNIGLESPIWAYDRTNGTTVTGGYVYRGSNLPNLYGKYIFADYGSGKIWSLTKTGENNISVKELFKTTLNIATFGTDSNEELYLADYSGEIYMIERVIQKTSTV
ncbi:MAG: Quinoprotein glucose dehydrogenase B precursor [Candidatus Heimdallarchaeota archaeon LC_3]|nr:MAG: Quinoprotein glucose dehydrogenase B precursor [Candidatus Heimdallarchaeota archaeon LC_3]